MHRLLIPVLLCSLVSPLGVSGYSIRDAEEDLRNQQFEKVLSELKPDQFSGMQDQSYAFYLLGTAAFNKEDYKPALAFYEKVISDFSDSRWFVKATYRKAECFMFLKRYDEAEAIYARGAEGLMSDARRTEIADMYTRYADRFYAPEKKGEQPAYNQARTLYERAKEILPKGPKWERVSYQIAMTHVKQEQWDEAQKKFSGLISYYESKEKSAAPIIPEATTENVPNPYPRGGYLDDASLHRGEALYRLGNKVEARRIWKKMRDTRRTDSKRPEIIADAAYRVAKTYDMPQPSNEKDLALGIRSHDQYVSLFPEHENIPLAALEKAKAYFHRAQYEKALEAFRALLDRYREKASPEQKASAEFHIARCLLELEKFDDAIAAYEAFLTHHPVDENWREAQQSIVHTRYRKMESLQRQAEKELARWKREIQSEKRDPQKEPIPVRVTQRYDNARGGWESFQQAYPLDGRIPNIQLLLGKNERALRRVEAAVGIWKDLASRFPKSDPASEALFLIAETTEKELGDYDKAVDLYKEVTFGPYEGPAQERIRSLQEILLALRTEHTFRCNEKPTVHVTTRNIEHLTCKLYPLDLKAYFQSKHTIRRVEDLDVNLIAPDKVWEVTPEGYKPYKEIAQDISIPVDGPGAWVMKVESETLEAVTLLFVSDLAIAIKGGRNEIFVYAEDQRNENSLEGADIFVSDGKGVITQGKTNRDGVFHVRDLKATEADRLAVFAAYEGNWAGDILGIQDLNVVTSLQPRVLVYSDRPTYQPGDQVNYRALIREIKDGQYVIPQDFEFEVSILDSRGTLIHRQKDKLSDFGTLHSEFALDESAPLGEYRIIVSRKDGPSGAWLFEVQEFTLPTARVEIETEQNTYFYGDEISGAIKVSDFSGNPLPGERVTYVCATETHEGVTGKDGKIDFRFETWDLPEEGQVVIVGIIPNRQVQGGNVVMLVNTGFTISLNTTRTTYLAGEPFQVRTTTRSRDEKRGLVENPLKISLQKRNDEGAYETVESRNITTSANERSIASVTFTANTGGEYRVVAEGTDRRGTLVTGERVLRISGEDDANKILILSDESRYQQGETAEFTVVSRLPENLCLMTGEREGVVEYRIERLKMGKNSISWKLDDRYSPTAVVSLVVMFDNQFYQRDAYFEVHRGLDVAITPNSKTYAPRDEAELLIETRDHTGKPVVAEFSLGIVDTALLALFPDRVEDLGSFFEQAAGGRFIATTSSAGFAYDGVTRPISKEVLRELAGGEEKYLGEEERGGGLRAGRAVRERRIETLRLLTELPPVALAPPAAAALREELGRATTAGGVAGGGAAIRGEVLGLADADAEIMQQRYAAGKHPALRASMAFNGAAEVPEMRHARYFFAGYGGLQSAGVSTITRSYFPKTAYFNPAVITDKEGKATVRIKLPDSLTTWEIQSRAITKETLANQAKEKVVVDKPYRVEMETPEFLTEGDQSSGIAIVRNNTAEKRDAKSAFIQTIAGRKNQVEWDSTLEPGDIQKRAVTLSAEMVGDCSVTLRSSAGDQQDTTVKSVSVLPWGIPVRAGKSAIAGQSAVEQLSLPSQVDYSRLRMWVTLGGVGDISLIAPAWSHPISARSTRAGIENGLAAVAALDCAEQLKKSEQVPVESLRKQVEAAVRHAIAAQSDRGLWAWSGGRGSAPDILTTGRAVELLRKAKERGFSVPEKTLEQAASSLSDLYQKTADDGEKARLLYAWSSITSPDFTFVNRIHRNLTRLDAFDTALLGLTWLNMGRIEKAQEVLNHLLESQEAWNKDLRSTPTGRRLTSFGAPCVSTDEVLASVARLYFQLPPIVRTEQQTKRFLDKLASDPVRLRFESAIPLGLRIQALSAYLLSAAEETNSFTLVAKVNGREVLNRRTSRSVLPYEEIEIDAAIVKASGNRIDFAFAGQGRYRYTVVLEGWTKQDVKPQDWIEPQNRLINYVVREYEHGPLMYKQEEIPRGYSVVEGSVQPVQNKLEEICPGDRINIRLRVDTLKDQDYVIVEEHIPAGFLLLKDSIHGPVDHYFLRDNTLTLYLRGAQRYFYVTYQLRGRFTGTYRVPPAILTTLENPGQIYATSSNSILVLPEGEKPKKAYTPTPDELYHLGIRNFEDGDYEEARVHLTQLIHTYPLRPEPYLETARKLFQIHLKGNNSEELVRYFEIIKERDQEFEIQFDQIETLAKAYRNIGECERAVYVYRSLLEGVFLQEGAVSGMLQEVNRHREALDYTKQLILEYPDIPSVQTAVYTTGTIIYQNVDRWAREPDFVKSGNDRKALLAEAVGMIESFLALYPTHPMADEAGYTLINLWLDQKNYEVVNRLAESFAQRYTKSTYLDSYDYLRAYALFQLERYEQALQLAQKVSTEEYPSPGGGMKKSDEANTAIHIAGKILHAVGDLDRALNEYERVKESFGDAVKSIEFLTKKGLSMDEVFIFKAGEPASIKLRHKNLDQVDLRVYKVDLMTFYLSEQDLERMTGINLAGITPVMHRTLNLKDSKRFEWNEMKLDLPFEQPGAYLIVLESDGVLASGMLLRSDLEIEVQEDAPQGVVRVNARAGSPPTFAKGVKVQVRGSSNDRFVSGETDLRGVFTAADIKGVATVLAQAGDQYGFYRGTQALGRREGVEAGEKVKAEAPEPQKVWGELDALGQNTVRLRTVQQEQSHRWNIQTDVSNVDLFSQKAKSLY